MCLKAIDLSMEYGVEDKIFGKILARLGNLDQQEGNYSSGLLFAMNPDSPHVGTVLKDSLKIGCV